MLTIIRIIPTTIAIVAFNLGPPGAFIKRVKFGLRNAPIPNNKTISPTIVKIKFTVSMVSI